MLNLLITPERHAMQQRALSASQPHAPLRGWLFSLLVLTMVMLLGVTAMASPEPASPHSVVGDSPSQASLTSSEPQCEHGHGGQHDVETLLRTERLDVDETITHRPVPALAPPPVAIAIGLPNAAPTLAHSPLYLLTQRLRP